MPNGDLRHDSHIPHSFELVFESVKHRRVSNCVVTNESKRRKMFRTRYVYFLAVYVCCQFQTAYFRAVSINCFHVEISIWCKYGQIVHLFVCQTDRGTQIDSAKLAQQHSSKA